MNKQPLDLTFIVNEPGKTLKDRFEELIKDCRFFDCLSGYFYISGFHILYNALENTEKIRILIGIGLDKEVYELIGRAKESTYPLSSLEIKNKLEEEIQKELDESEDKLDIEMGIRKFIEWIKNGKLEVRVYSQGKIHAKLYILTFKEGDRDVGRVITGSSNFTQAGLKDNLEFNVELKNRSDYEFAKQKFEELWSESEEVNRFYEKIVLEKTWLREDISPYDLYLKFLYEYFKDQLSIIDEINLEPLPSDVMNINYQKEAAVNAKRILEEYGGVFISDVVGTGKTYIVATLLKQLDGRTLVIAPPILLNENDQGSWKNVFYKFNISAKFFSIGKLEDAVKEIRKDEYIKNIVIDESHRFRNESTISYDRILEVCRGKRIILVSATPYNNRPLDILNQIKLFQNVRKSLIPGVENLEDFFKEIESRLKNIRRDKEYDKYLEITRNNAKEIREKVLKYIMIRRTRKDIEKYYAEDLKKNNIKFPEVEGPKSFYYQLNKEEDEIFVDTIKFITKSFKYARYTPLLYLKKTIIDPLEEQRQKNIAGFMKVLLVKRLESSFYAFRQTLDRFIKSYERFIEEFKKGNVYISKKYSNRIFELLETENDESIIKLIEEGKVEKYKSDDFKPEFLQHLENDLEILKQIKEKWSKIKRDPKLEKLLYELANNPILKKNKLIIFTESKETAEYLTKEINNFFNKEITLLFHSQSPKNIKDEIIANFDLNTENSKNNYLILVSTDVLSEGVNLRRSNVVINYDIPWNPTRLIQRVGRINRVDTRFDKIYVFNFFPTVQSESEIELTKIARKKVEEFLNLLGEDAAILTEGEPVSSHELFDKLVSKDIFVEEEESPELKYFKEIEKIKNEKPELFEKIKNLPKKARSGKIFPSSESLLTFFRKGKLMKFFITDLKTKQTRELDFLDAVKIFECKPDTKQIKIPLKSYYELLTKNKEAFYNTTTEEEVGYRIKPKSNEYKLIKILEVIRKNPKQLTENQEELLDIIIKKLKDGMIPKGIIKKTLSELKKLKKDIESSLKVIKVLNQTIPSSLLKEYYVKPEETKETKREIILSLYLRDKDEY